MRFRFNTLLLLIIILLIQGCSGKSEDSQVIEAKDDSSVDSAAETLTSTTINNITTNTSFQKEPTNDKPQFLFDTESAGQLSTDWRDDLLAELRVATPDFETLYVREEWGPGWIDENYNCINTRHEVLVQESYEEVIFEDRGCKVVKGKWYDYFSGEFYDDPTELDIDHMVPLHNAHVSGASHWPTETKISFYNDLNDPQHLIAVSSSANRSKGSRGPEVWRPSNEEHWCQYAYSWIEIKARWNLSVSDIELTALAEMLNSCDGLPEMTYWFSNWLLRKGAMSTPEMSPTENEQTTELQESYSDNTN